MIRIALYIFRMIATKNSHFQAIIFLIMHSFYDYFDSLIDKSNKKLTQSISKFNIILIVLIFYRLFHFYSNITIPISMRILIDAKQYVSFLACIARCYILSYSELEMISLLNHILFYDIQKVVRPYILIYVLFSWHTQFGRYKCNKNYLELKFHFLVIH